MSKKIKHLILVIALLLVNVILLSAYSVDVDVEVWVTNMVCVSWTTSYECTETDEVTGECTNWEQYNVECNSYEDQGGYETETISVGVPDGTPPEDI